ncbi:MAG: Asp-tRNA(Asn)/Glu-tRNA(Gln) amidotransferase subunit GatC [Gammaproteobacteria bacterium]|nr:Asp-tRNA(Asn)/Glu-tRNA(Gln) amidotransferase subunit GatC [Gammaproteobacteria bacterium]
MDDLTIQRLMSLSQLSLDAEDKDKISRDLDAIIGFIEIMNKVDTEGVEPLAHAVDLDQPLREDRADLDIDRGLFQSIAPETADGFYLVPKVLDRR